jgi:hypothetical protein
LSDWLCHADILGQIPDEPDPLIRFGYSQAKRRWVSNEQNLEGEEIGAMPPFKIPPIVERADGTGVMQPIAQIHTNTEANIGV